MASSDTKQTREKIPVTPDLLVWARKTAGMNLSEVAQKMGKDVSIIKSWEMGDANPTYIQLEKLAYQIYKRPLALFFFPEPPEEETPRQSFRTLPDKEIEFMSSRMHYLLKKARSMQVNLAELNDFTNPAKKNIIRDLKFQSSTPVDIIADRVRDYLGIDLDQQFRWSGEVEALNSWRNRLQEYGVYIFKESFKDDTYSGFCLYDDDFPLIYLNNSTSKNRQIFSIFHELAHLLFGTGGVDAEDDTYIGDLEGENKRIEIICNKFSGAFLVPDKDFSPRIAQTSLSDNAIMNLSKMYKVSREVILRKYLDKGLIKSSYYSRKVAQWTKELRKYKKSGGGNFYATQGTYLGEGYMSLAFTRFYQNRISENQLADYLGVKVKNISGMESLIFEKGGLP